MVNRAPSALSESMAMYNTGMGLVSWSLSRRLPHGRLPAFASWLMSSSSALFSPGGLVRDFNHSAGVTDL